MVSHAPSTEAGPWLTTGIKKAGKICYTSIVKVLTWEGHFWCAIVEHRKCRGKQRLGWKSKYDKVKFSRDSGTSY